MTLRAYSTPIDRYGRARVELADLREDWMVHAGEILDDEAIVAVVYEALSKRHPHSRSRGRRGAPADMVLRLLVLKHVRNWSYQALEREVRANLVYRDFAHRRGQDAGCQDHRSLGRSRGAGGHQGGFCFRQGTADSSEHCRVAVRHAKEPKHEFTE